MRPLYVVVGSDLPSAIFFMNRGVFLVTGSTDAVDFLKHLSEMVFGRE